MATRDGSWEVDLIWRYLYETKNPGRPTEGWYKNMDPKGSLNNRQYVYEMLVGNPSQTNPKGDKQIDASMIPWNQQNTELVKTFKTNLACGSVVKLTFRKYMGWGPGEYHQRRLNHRGWNAIKWIVQSLKAGKPVRAYLEKKNHYIGIVGFRSRSVPQGDSKTDMTYEFLCIDPWAGGSTTGGNTIAYAGGTTKFLGIARQEGTKLTYDSYEITAVEGPFPF